MSSTDQILASLRTSIEAGEHSLRRDKRLDPRWVTNVVVPKLSEVVDTLHTSVDQVHKLNVYTVVHYTTTAAAISILRGVPNGRPASLRLYDSANFNDPEEGEYLLRYLRLPNKHKKWLGSRAATHAYISSFIIPDTKRDDAANNLMFWRTYGRDGEGCSLKLTIPSTRLRQVLYGPDPVKPIRRGLLPVLNTLYPLVKIGRYSDRHQATQIQNIIADPIWQFLERIRYLYKGTPHQDEKECRFIVTKADADISRVTFETEERDASVVKIRHYYEDDDLATSKIFATDSSITLGPRVPDQYNVVFYLEALKQQAGFSEYPAVVSSDIPYRKTR